MYCNKPEPISYYDEISKMMFGFGDSQTPNPETVRLVESVTLSQLKLIVQEARKYQDGKTLNGEELVFLMRKNKYKMQRFIKYLQNKEARKKAEAKTLDDSPLPKNKLIDFIEYMDETGELTDLSDFDEVKYERMIRADRISQALDEESYIKFSNARCASFMRRTMAESARLEKFRLWLDLGVECSNVAVDVLSYFAYETVAQITDYAFLVRMDHNRKADPLSNLQGAYFSADMFNGEDQFNEQNWTRVHSGKPPISVAEIKEVMRRVYMPQAGKLTFGGKLPDTCHILAI